MMDYRQAGVDVEAGYEAVALMKKHIRTTYNDDVLGDVGSFGGFYSISRYMGMAEPVLVAGTDGVGTKLKVAFALDKHDTVGIDCVAMCVNDVVCQGAQPLFFLDYMATGKLEPQKAAAVVSGISEGCRQSGSALIGGETAEMPGFYAPGEYDLAGFSVGIVDRPRAISGAAIQKGDVLIGLQSSGVHSNGFSLIRKLLGDTPRDMAVHIDELGKTVGEELLTPTRIYVKNVLDLTSQFSIHGVAHITGGGFIENIPRMVPQGLAVEIQLGSWPIAPIFGILQRKGNMAQRSIYNTFNMGIGMVLAAAQQDADAIVKRSIQNGDNAYVIGRIVPGDGGVELCAG
ncbi:MAG: phosphoribosylformylglycinamidine cyclo-ligase [Eubacteriales bacterium]|nr:phosphoribosylformylglycinamidine cyclo-ligase [Eubacteriales bacterium]